MKKNKVYLIFLVVFAVAAAGIWFNYSKQKKDEEQKIYGLVERKGPGAPGKEWIALNGKAEQYRQAISNDPGDTKSALALAALFIQEARISGNYAYYDKAAMKTVNDVLAIDPDNFEALVYKALIYYSQHHFAEGLETAEKAKSINPHNAYVYGLMVDGHVEMGNYDSAIVNSDRMVSIRPDLTSYSRISYLREIFGDYKGAIEAMKMAVEAGGPGDEYTEWSRVQLASLLEKTGDYQHAEMLYYLSLNLRPGYPYALAGLGRVAVARKDYDRAIQYYQRADSAIDDYSVKEALADTYRLSGKPTEAQRLFKEVIDDLSENAEAANSDESIGHYADRELAYAYLKVNDNDKALEHALMEYNRRPGNIDVNETVAWVYYNRGEPGKALPYIKRALKTESKNPVLLSRAALIFYKTGDKGLARTMLSQSGGTNAQLDPALFAETEAVITKL